MHPNYSKTVFVIQLGLVAFYFLFGSNTFLWLAVGLGLISVVIPRASQGIAWGWSRLSRALGWMSSRILLAVTFILVLTPVAAVSRLLGRSHLVKKRPNQTNWKATRHTFTPDDLRDPF